MMAAFRLFITILLLFVCVINNYGQCHADNDRDSNFKIYKSYIIDSITVNSAFYPLLDHSVAILDTLKINQHESWMYYVICLNEYSPDKNDFFVRISLRQGVGEELRWSEITFARADSIHGAFCYKGYTFFILLNPKNEFIFNKYFKSANYQVPFNVFNGKRQLQKLGIDTENPYMLTQAFIVYHYFDNKLFHFQTVYLE